MLFLGLLALIGCDLAQLAIPGILGSAVDLLGQDAQSTRELFWPVLSIIGLAFFVAFMRYLWRRLIVGFSRLVEMDLRGQLYSHMVFLSPSWHQENLSGDMMALATNDIESVRMAISFGVISLVDALVMGFVALAFLMAISPSLTLWAILPMPFITIVTHYYGHRIYKLLLTIQNIFGELTEVVREQLAGLKIIRAMGLSPLALAESDKKGQEYLRHNVKLAIYMGNYFPFLHLMYNFSVALIIYFGGLESVAGKISTGDFVAFISLLALLSWPMMAMGMVFGILQQGLASLSRLRKVFEAKEVEAGGKILIAPLKITPKIEARNLSFCYPSRTEDALKDLTLSLAPDKISALVGPIGSGKSTLVQLILGLYQAPLNSLYIGGQAIEAWPLNGLRRLFGYVPQDSFMFSGTILENLCFGNPSATMAEAERALELSHFAADVKNFTHGLETLVGEKGVTLSGGQKQRLALARALILNPAYLVMDDTLSAVDLAVEHEILQNLAVERKGRGLLLITHRVTSLAIADEIFVLENGQLTGQGNMSELLAHNAYFRRIYELAQMGLETPKSDYLKGTEND